MERDKMMALLGHRIQTIRKSRGESQAELGKALGIHREVIKTWEDGTRQIKAPDLIALADYFDCTIDFLVGRSDNLTRDKDVQEICDYIGLSAATVNYLHNAISPSTRSFYRLLFDRIIQKGDYGLDDIREMIRESAKAGFQARIKDPQNNRNRFQKCDDGRISFSASNAEQYLLYASQNELNIWLRDILLDMELDCINELKKTGCLQDNYIWQISQSDLFRGAKPLSEAKGESDGEHQED